MHNVKPNGRCAYYYRGWEKTKAECLNQYYYRKLAERFSSSS